MITDDPRTPFLELPCGHPAPPPASPTDDCPTCERIEAAKHASEEAAEVAERVAQGIAAPAPPAMFIICNDEDNRPNLDEVRHGRGILGAPVPLKTAQIDYMLKYEARHPSTLVVGESCAGIAGMSGWKPIRYHVVRVA